MNDIYNLTGLEVLQISEARVSAFQVSGMEDWFLVSKADGLQASVNHGRTWRNRPTYLGLIVRADMCRMIRANEWWSDDSPRGTIVIDRSRWARKIPETGEWTSGRMATLLFDNNGYRCCLGFAAEQYAGIHRGKLLNKSYPSQLSIKDSCEALTKLIECEEAAVAINDNLVNDEGIIAYETSQAQEEAIAKLFRERLGVEVEFVN